MNFLNDLDKLKIKGEKKNLVYSKIVRKFERLILKLRES